jgi:hypothetical protein
MKRFWGRISSQQSQQSRLDSHNDAETLFLNADNVDLSLAAGHGLKVAVLLRGGDLEYVPAHATRAANAAFRAIPSLRTVSA